MHDLATRMVGEDCLGQQADQVVALDEAAVVVEEETAVEIAIPRNAEVRAMFAHGVGGGGAVFRQQWIGNAVGKLPSGSWQMRMNSNGRCGASRSTMAPAPPLPALTTICSGLSLLVST